MTDLNTDVLVRQRRMDDARLRPVDAKSAPGDTERRLLPLSFSYKHKDRSSAE